MKFKISLTIDEGANHKVEMINLLTDSLENYFSLKSYGTSINDILIGLTCVNIPKGFEHLFKLQKPFYVDFKIIKNQHTGELIELKEHFYYSIKFEKEEYDEFINSSDEESKNLLIELLLKSLSNFDTLPKKVKNFNKEKFTSDMKAFFRGDEHGHELEKDMVLA